MAEPEIIFQILNSEVVVLGIIVGVIALLSKVIIPKVLSILKNMLEKRQSKEGGIPESLGTLKVFIRSGDMIKEARGRILKDGSIAADGKTWVIERIRPYLLTKGRNSRPALFLDAVKQVEYRFKDAVESNSLEKHQDIAGQATDPHLLKQFSDSIVIQKLAAAKPDKTMMLMVFMLGMFALMVVQQFIPTGGGVP
ncbi:hypothetical protein [Nitrososphaera sp.]|uniref:hypothetical protein n=1 Tax=Nitrososphaera sp. TaxID=1971748 RepID=UPI00317772FA